MRHFVSQMFLCVWYGCVHAHKTGGGVLPASIDLDFVILLPCSSEGKDVRT